ncbi:uncharacterized protein PV06_09330 [Exophiala oligosperma]|uniref:Uncharacterized protein n=1 Tax=Exophiala oligosperma TaxID=215243 RepID=A0A0D2D571_9EURO|nr:uncharacterized protein PV06_09330 [Exophiala oligosperma]KIW38358.1 hypothetical protein PV06_09330 [Exophiala oligosperma]
MQELDLGDTSFIHRDSNVGLHTKTTVHISGEWQSQNSLLPWCPRSKRLLCLFRICFDLSLNLTLITSGRNDFVRFIADWVAGAELWKQLGYDTSCVQYDNEQTLVSTRAFSFQLELKSFNDDGQSATCPETISPVSIQRFELTLHFTHQDSVDVLPASQEKSRARRQHSSFSLDNETNKSSSGEPDREKRHQTSQGNCHPVISELVTTFDEVRLKNKSPSTSLLDGQAFLMLLDMGIRSSISSRLIRPPAGFRRVTELESTPLAAIFPSCFAQQYAQRFDEQCRFIPAITRWLAPFSVQTKVPVDGAVSAQVHKSLWLTLAHGLRDRNGERILRSLCSSRAYEDFMLDSGNQNARDYGLMLQDDASCNNNLEDFPETELGYEDDTSGNLFDIEATVNQPANYYANYNPGVTSRGVNDQERATTSESFETWGYRYMPFNVHKPVSQADHPGDLPCPRRHSADNTSQMSDASMLTASHEPMANKLEPQESDFIGRSDWLTQNIIRMHPLMQHEQDPDLFEVVDCHGRRHGINEPDHHGWPEGESRALTVGKKEECVPQYTCCQHTYLNAQTTPPRGHCDSRHSSNENIATQESTVSMSGDLKQSSSNTSLADALGDDHLLWHMWKRRASVVPRGEEDVLEMKMMFQTDPDMKLFGHEWSLDPDPSPADKNNGFTSHEGAKGLRQSQGQRNKTTTPMSDKRSYSSASDSSSSSLSYVGRSSSEPKPQRRGSLIKRFSWGGRHHTPDMSRLDVTKLNDRTMEVKRRKTLDDYEVMNNESLDDDSNDMLF